MSTNFTFNPGIPAAPDNPSVDQPVMQQNNASINSIIGINHISFNTENGGMHTAINFAQNGGGQAFAPVPPVNVPTLFTNIVDGAGNTWPSGFPQLFYYRGPDLNTKDQYISATPGSALLFGGIVIKWGGGADTKNPTSFVKAFPTSCFVVLITGNDAAYTGGFVATFVTASSFIAKRTDGTVDPTAFYYLAIGY